jgi:hypothetical protein
VLTGAYRDLLTAVAGSAAALTGLLFVALSVAPRPKAASYPAVIRDIRAAAALLAFTNVLAVSLFSLVPGTNAGYPAVAAALIGLLFTAASLRSIIASPETTGGHVQRQAGLIVLLLVAFGFELGGGIELLARPASQGGAQSVSYAMIGLVLVGIARAWELVGDRGTGILTSIAVLAGRDGAAAGGASGSDADNSKMPPAGPNGGASAPAGPADPEDGAQQPGR